VYNALTLPNIKSFPDFAVHTIDDVSFIMMPYRDKKMMSMAKTKEEAIDKIKEKITTLSAGLSGKKIAIGHYMIGEAVAGDEQTFSIDELVLPLSMFDSFDATFCGHIHGFKVLQKSPAIIYTGSMERITMGDRHNEKVSIVLDTDTMDMEIIPTKTRDLHEIDLNYADGDKYYKALITDQIIADIEEFGVVNKLEGAIVKLTAMVKTKRLLFCRSR
jgi:DNA repair exonuclease SbcCD nuclease subunit